MRIVAVSAAQSTKESQLVDAQHRLRAKIFSERLGWEVDVKDGREFDRFDRLRPTYILAVLEGGKVAGCARLLPAIGPTMLAGVFPSLLPDGRLHAHPAMVESSRFCVDTNLAEGRGDGWIHAATLTMFAGIIEWCIVNLYTEIITVTDLRFERILARAGWPLDRLGEPRRIGATMAVAGTLPVNTETFERLCPSDYSSDLVAVGRVA